MLKRYYSIAEAIDFLASEAKAPIQQRDIFDLAGRGLIRLCVYIPGKPITLANPLGEVARWGDGKSFAHGYLTGYIALWPFHAQRNASFPWGIWDRFSIKEQIGQEILLSEVRERALTEEDNQYCYWAFSKEPESLAAMVEQATTGPKGLQELIVNDSDLLIPAEDLLRTRSPGTGRSAEAIDQVEPRRETAYLNTIGVLLELILNHRPGRTSQAAVIDEMIRNYPEKFGISKSGLEQKFAAARKSLT